MHHRPPSPVRPAAVLALALSTALPSAMLGGCAEMHRGVESVSRIGGAPAAAVADDDGAAPAGPGGKPGVKTVRPGPRTARARRAPEDAEVGADLGAAEPVAPPAVVASAVPSPRQIFDFHPAGSSPDSWRQPFVIDTNDGPLAADVRRSTAALKSFLADQKAGRAGGTEAGKAALAARAGRDPKVDDVRTGTTRKLCGEMDVASGKPGCAVPRPGTAASQ